jgi:hypothetical protein
MKTLINCWNSLVVLVETLAPFHLLTFFLSCLCYSIARFYHQPSHLLGLDLKRNVGVSRCFSFFHFLMTGLDFIYQKKTKSAEICDLYDHGFQESNPIFIFHDTLHSR